MSGRPLLPYLIITSLLFGNYSFVVVQRRNKWVKFHIQTGPFARFLMMPATRLRNQFKHLEKLGLIKLDLEFGSAVVSLDTTKLNLGGLENGQS